MLYTHIMSSKPKTRPIRNKNIRFGTAALLGLTASCIAGMTWGWDLAPLIGWDASALFFMALLWSDFWGRTPQELETVVRRDDMGNPFVDITVTVASLVSIAAVALMLTSDGTGLTHVGFGLVSIVISWATVHSSFALRYAGLYFEGQKGGIDFNSQEAPSFVDFAYIAFTIGMTYQVSDTSISSRRIRRLALRHAIISFVFGTAIIATTINFVASLSG